MTVPSIGCSKFAEKRHTPGSGYSYFKGSWIDLIDLISENWHKREPGFGRTDLTQVVVVPVPANRFVGGTILVNEDTVLHVKMARRAPDEDPYICVEGEGECEPVKFANVVLYSADTLLENDGERSTDADWEIVAITASAIMDEPLHPLTIARNLLEKPGGTFAPCSVEELAESVYYWSRRVKSISQRKKE